VLDGHSIVGVISRSPHQKEELLLTKKGLWIRFTWSLTSLEQRFEAISSEEALDWFRANRRPWDGEFHISEIEEPLRKRVGRHISRQENYVREVKS
jgi:hypothetical protein